MDKKGQNGQNAIWDSGLAKGSSRSGDNCMQVLKAPLPYKAGPISSLAK